MTWTTAMLWCECNWRWMEKCHASLRGLILSITPLKYPGFYHLRVVIKSQFVCNLKWYWSRTTKVVSIGHIQHSYNFKVSVNFYPGVPVWRCGVHAGCQQGGGARGEFQWHGLCTRNLPPTDPGCSVWVLPEDNPWSTIYRRRWYDRTYCSIISIIAVQLITVVHLGLTYPWWYKHVLPLPDGR